MKKCIQIVTVVFALTMLVCFVLYSQSRHNRGLAPGSKARAVLDLKKDIESHNAPTGSQTLARITNAVASYAPTPPSKSTVFAPGSKSAAVVTMKEIDQIKSILPTTYNTTHQPITAATNTQKTNVAVLQPFPVRVN